MGYSGSLSANRSASASDSVPVRMPGSSHEKAVICGLLIGAPRFELGTSSPTRASYANRSTKPETRRVQGKPPSRPLGVVGPVWAVLAPFCTRSVPRTRLLTGAHPSPRLSSRCARKSARRVDLEVHEVLADLRELTLRHVARHEGVSAHEGGGCDPEIVVVCATKALPLSLPL
jgi:hypothetical protein